MAETDVTGAQGFASDSRRYGVFCWGLLLSTVLLLLVVVVLTAVQLTAVDNTVLVLSVLVVCLIFVGALACFFLERLRRRALRRRDEGAKDWIHHTLSENELAIEQEPPPLPEPNASSFTLRSSWIHWAPWKSRKAGPPSSRSTGPPSTRSTGPPSTRSTDSPFYASVGRNGR